MPSAISDPAIRVESLSKRYRLNSTRRYETLRDSLAELTGGVWSRITSRNSTRTTSEPKEFWALKDVNFDVQRGEVLGIIGRNGAGKSTLLKILSRITEPTSGEVTLRGRVAALLEVGTGFHPELTGRENVFLNGAVLGLTRSEIRARFDEIVAFAEVGPFLDSPVKHFSSGMQMRLAFAVAAHLEPEILIVDEVLAVGDLAFQKKCMGKMSTISQREGRTVLFVSHNLSAVRQLCRSALLLNAGKVEAHGLVNDVLNRYTEGFTEHEDPGAPRPSPDLLERGYIVSVAIENREGQSTPEVGVGELWRIRVRIRLERQLDHVIIAAGLVTSDGIPLQTTWSTPQNWGAGDHEAVFTQDKLVLSAGSYAVVIGLSERERALQQFEAGRIHVSNERITGSYPATSGAGLILNGMSVEVRHSS